MNTPIVTIFVRHSADCKYAGDKFCKRCSCRKHFRCTQNGVQYRRKAGPVRGPKQRKINANSKTNCLGVLLPYPKATEQRSLVDAVDLLLKDKKAQGVSEDVQGKYTRELARLRTFCESEGVYAVQGITREWLTNYRATWADEYPSTITRTKVRERLRSFLRYCYEANGWTVSRRSRKFR